MSLGERGVRVRKREGGMGAISLERERGGGGNQFRERGGRNLFLIVQSNIPVFAIYDWIEYK